MRAEVLGNAFVECEGFLGIALLVDASEIEPNIDVRRIAGDDLFVLRRGTIEVKRGGKEIRQHAAVVDVLRRHAHRLPCGLDCETRFVERGVAFREGKIHGGVSFKPECLLVLKGRLGIIAFQLKDRSIDVVLQRHIVSHFPELSRFGRDRYLPRILSRGSTSPCRRHQHCRKRHNNRLWPPTMCSHAVSSILSKKYSTLMAE